jgi:branched-chain amino acid transport system substrate-binding protein
MKIPVLANMTAVDEGVLKNMGDEALGVVSAGWYSAAIDNPYNKAFVQAINRDYGADPGVYTVGTYGAGLMLEHALKEVKGRIEDKAAFMKALRGVVVEDDPRGAVRLDEFGNPVMNVYIRKAERKNGKLVNTVIHTYPNVSQFWTYDQKQFLANPVYTRDYPPAKNLE